VTALHNVGLKPTQRYITTVTLSICVSYSAYTKLIQEQCPQGVLSSAKMIIPSCESKPIS